MRVGIIGAGLMGMALAERLSSAGHEVHVFERADQPGGLTTWADFGTFVWDRFYHVILPSDRSLLAFLRRIGLGDRLCWNATRTGYYLNGRLWSLSNGLEFLRFPLLGALSKARLAWTILYCSRITDWKRLENMTVEEFLVQASGRSTFEAFWKPLLLAKLGESYRRVSAVFIWTYIRRLFSARDSTTQKEQLGYVKGGYRVVFQVLEQLIERNGGRVRTGVEVVSIDEERPVGLVVETSGGRELFDRIVFTGPVDVMRKVVSPKLVDAPVAGDIEYLGVVCLVLVTRKPVVSCYVVNISDETVPFTGVIGMTSLVDTRQTGGLHLTYFPKYVLSGDPLLRDSDDELLEVFLEGFRRMFPDYAKDDVVSARIHKAARVQPLQVKGYSSLVQPPQTRSPLFFVVNTAQFVHSTLNNNEVVGAVDAFVERYAADFPGVPQNDRRGNAP
jgi:protoporphyrinogen oxidase